MAKTISASSSPPESDLERFEEKHLEEERMRDVLLMIEHLIKNEEITAKIIIDCLYDVGSVNLINRRFSHRILNGVMKHIARFSKPVFRVYAWRWFKRNCPQLITDWLYSQVAFKKPNEQPKEIVLDTSGTTISSQTDLESLHSEIRHLRAQIRWLSGIAISAIAALSGAIVWLNNRPPTESLQIPNRSLQTMDMVEPISTNPTWR